MILGGPIKRCLDLYWLAMAQSNALVEIAYGSTNRRQVPSTGYARAAASSGSRHRGIGFTTRDGQAAAPRSIFNGQIRLVVVIFSIHEELGKNRHIQQ